MEPVPFLRAGYGGSPAEGGCIMQVIDWIHRNQWTDGPPCVHPVIRQLAIRTNDGFGDEDRQQLLDLAPRLMNTANTDGQVTVDLAIFCAEYVLPIFETRFSNDDRPRKAIEAAKSGNDVTNARRAMSDVIREITQRGTDYAANAVGAAHAVRAALDAAESYDADDLTVYAMDAADLACSVYDAGSGDDVLYGAELAANCAVNALPHSQMGRLSLLLAVLNEYDRLTGRTEVQEVNFAPVCAVMNAG